MSATDIDPKREVKKVKKRIEDRLKPMKGKDRDYFSKIRTAVKKQK